VVQKLGPVNMASTRTVRVSQAVYEAIKQDLRQNEIVDDVLRRAFHLEAVIRKRHAVRPSDRDLSFQIRDNSAILWLRRRPGAVRFKLPTSKYDTEANAKVRKKVVDFARERDISEQEIERILREFRKHGYFLRRRAAHE